MKKLPETLPVALTIPAVNTLPPVILPVADTTVPVKLAEFTIVVAITLLAITLPTTLAKPPVTKLLPCTLPVADTTPVTNNPLVAKLAILALDATLTVTLLLLRTCTLLVPFDREEVLRPVS